MQLTDFGLTDLVHAETASGVPLIGGTFAPGEHDRVWRELRAAHPRTGLWPVLGGDAEWTAEASKRYGDRQGPAWLEAVLTVDPAERMALIRRSHYEWCVEDFVDSTPGDLENIAYYDSELTPDLLVQSLPAHIPEPEGIRRHSESGYREDDCVLLVPARFGYEVPALAPNLLRTDNWRGGSSHRVLTTVDHVAVLRYFEAAYGAELYYAAGDRLELAVSRPPTTPLAVAICAIEQFSFCDDLGQILGDVDVVAREQAPARHWTFWWD